jgi:hypothetical protein
MIHQSSMLVDLNISVWTGRKLDKRVSEEIDQAKNTRTKAGNYNKHLLAGSEKLEAVQKIAGAIRTWHYEQTLPWSDGGSRLLPMKNFFDYKASLNSFRAQFEQAVEDLLVAYPELVSASAFQLGALFDRSEYPDAEELRHKFKFKYSFSPVPEVGDFRIETGEEVKRELQEQYQAMFDEKLNDAMKDVWERLHETLRHMSTKLADSPNPRTLKDGTEVRAQIFRDSLINNAVELCGLLSKLNVTDDPKLEQARQDVERVLCGLTPKDVRDSDHVRADVKAEVDRILSKFDF